MFNERVNVCVCCKYMSHTRVRDTCKSCIVWLQQKILSVNYEKACFALTMVFFRKVMGVCKKKYSHKKVAEGLLRYGMILCFCIALLYLLSSASHRASFINCAKLLCSYASQLRTCQLLLGLPDVIFDSLKLQFRERSGLAWVLSS